MATNLKTTKNQLYCTPIDVRVMSRGIVQVLTHADTIDVDDARVELAILRACGIIDLKLGGVISGTSSLEVVPYAGTPIKPQAAYDETTTSENPGTGGLYGIIPASSAYTEMWTITFTSSTAYGVVGTFSGSQGTGATDANFTSSNSDITIPSDCWNGTHATDDKFYVPVYRHHKSIVMLATMLATGYIFKGSGMNIRTQDNEGAKLYYDAIALLDDVVNSGTLLGTGWTIDSRDLWVPYEINMSGYDITRYRTDEFDGMYAQSGYSWYDNAVDTSR